MDPLVVAAGVSADGLEGVEEGEAVPSGEDALGLLDDDSVTEGTLELPDLDPVWWTRGFGGQGLKVAANSAGVRWSRTVWCRWRL